MMGSWPSWQTYWRRARPTPRQRWRCGGEEWLCLTVVEGTLCENAGNGETFTPTSFLTWHMQKSQPERET